MFYDKINPIGAAVLTAILAPTLGDFKVATDLTPPGIRAACIKFKTIHGSDPRFGIVVQALEAAGLYPDILDSGYHRELSQAFVGKINTALLPPGDLRTRYHKEAPMKR